MDKHAIITIGPSGCGKSTWAKAKVKESKNTYVIIERDEIRFKDMPYGTWADYKTTKEKENNVTVEVNRLIAEANSQNKNIIISDTNLNPVFRNRLTHQLQELGYEVIRKIFYTPFEKCVKQDLLRIRSIGKSEIARQWEMYLKVLDEYGDESEDLVKEKVVRTAGLPKAIIVDIDGTLAKMDNRGPFEWTKVGSDTVNQPVKNLVKIFQDAGYVIIIFSGRDSVCYFNTFTWLQENGIEPIEMLKMREEKDCRRDDTVKYELFNKYVRGQYDVQYVIDDRPQVCRMWRQIGLTVLQVGNTDLEF